MKVQMSSGVTDCQRCSHSESDRPLPASISSSIEIALPPEPSMRITCSSFGARSRTWSIFASCSSSSTIDRLRVGVLEHVLAFVGRVRLVDRNDDGAHAECREVEVGPLGPGVGEDRDLVALLDAELDQAERQTADDVADLAVGLRNPLVRRRPCRSPPAGRRGARPRAARGPRLSCCGCVDSAAGPGGRSRCGLHQDLSLLGLAGQPGRSHETGCAGAHPRHQAVAFLV